MEIILCNENNLEDLIDFYIEQLNFFEKTINYPKWINGLYPTRNTIKYAVDKKYQYACLENGKIMGALGLNEDPGCKYENE